MAPKKEVGESSGDGAKRGRGRRPKRGRGGGGRGRGGGRGGGEDDAAVAMEEGSESLSPAGSDSSIGDFWDDFPIPEFVLTLYQLLGHTQWLPR